MGTFKLRLVQIAKVIRTIDVVFSIFCLVALVLGLGFIPLIVYCLSSGDTPIGNESDLFNSDPPPTSPIESASDLFDKIRDFIPPPFSPEFGYFALVLSSLTVVFTASAVVGIQDSLTFGKVNPTRATALEVARFWRKCAVGVILLSGFHTLVVIAAHLDYLLFYVILLCGFILRGFFSYIMAQFFSDICFCVGITNCESETLDEVAADRDQSSKNYYNNNIAVALIQTTDKQGK